MPTPQNSDRTRFYAVEQLGPKQSLTPDGFLICHDVPIARIGVMDYAEIELPDIEPKDGIVQIKRVPEEVFRPETLASFEGVAVTLDHPELPVTPKNWRQVAVGHVQNVRRGQGLDDGLMLADLVITDEEAIKEVRSSLREVSCGYDAAYKQLAPGLAIQREIVGNHVALVQRGRCGPICSIGDSHMATPKKTPQARQSFADKLRKLFMTRDSEEFEKALDELPTGEEGEGNHIHIHVPGAGDTPPAKAGTTDEPNPAASDPIAMLAEAVTKLSDRMTAIEAKLGEGAKPAADAGEGGAAAPAPAAAPAAAPASAPAASGGEQTDPFGDAELGAEEGGGEKMEPTKTGDSAAMVAEFQEARARAEILAPGTKLPTFDAKADAKRTTDSLCVLRRRALRAAAGNGNAEIVKTITGGADLAGLTCDSVKAYFNAASEVVKGKNNAPRATQDHGGPNPAIKDLNQVHADFWSKRQK